MHTTSAAAFSLVCLQCQPRMLRESSTLSFAADPHTQAHKKTARGCLLCYSSVGQFGAAQVERSYLTQMSAVQITVTEASLQSGADPQQRQAHAAEMLRAAAGGHSVHCQS